MKRFIKSKKGIALLATLAALAIAGGAYAYFTSTGSGQGSATRRDGGEQSRSHGYGSAALLPDGVCAACRLHDRQPGQNLRSDHLGNVTVSDITVDPALHQATAAWPRGSRSTARLAPVGTIPASCRRTPRSPSTEPSIQMNETRRQPGRLQGRDSHAHSHGGPGLVVGHHGGAVSAAPPLFGPVIDVRLEVEGFEEVSVRFSEAVGADGGRRCCVGGCCRRVCVLHRDG